MRVRRLSGAGELDPAIAALPWVRWGVDLESADQLWLDADCGALAVVRSRRAYGTSLVAFGPPAAAAALAETVAPGLDVTSLTLPRAAAVRPGSLLGPDPVGERWDWMWTPTAPPPVPAQERVEPFDLAAQGAPQELAAFLAANSPRHSAAVDDALARAWLGVRGPGGELQACVALYEAVPGVDLMASVAVAVEARGQGLGRAVAAVATRRMLQERPPAATVDLYADNVVARRLYLSLGYRLDQEFTSYPLMLS